MHEKHDDKLASMLDSCFLRKYTHISENGDDLMNDSLPHKGLRWRFVSINGKVGCALYHFDASEQVCRAKLTSR